MAGSALGAMKRAAARAGIAFQDYARRVAGGEKWCWRCRAMHPRSAFAADATRSDGLVPACRESQNLNQQARYKPRPRVSKLGSFFAPTRSDDAKQARARVNHHVDVGLIPDPNDLPCSDCGHVYEPGAKPRHEYDHYLGYSAENQLKVQAVCAPCHHKREESRRG